MNGYLSFYSAAAAWNIPYIEVVLGAEMAKAGLVEDITVLERKKRLSGTNRVKVHLCELELPSGALVVMKGRLVASPELLFLEFARLLHIHRLILLGLQLCSHPPGIPAEAISSVQKIRTFLTKTSRHFGHPRAVRAVKYIGDGSASIMESIVYMMLTLPHNLGGYALKGAVFNPEIRLKSESGKYLGQKRCFADLYYQAAKLLVEYESFSFHSKPAEQSKDAMRSVLLEKQRFEVRQLNTYQLYHAEAFHDFAHNLASRLSKRMNIRTRKFNEMHKLLRQLLPDGKQEADAHAKPEVVPGAESP